MGLEVKQGKVSYFWGLVNTATPNYSRLEGPIRLQFDENMTLTIPKLKVIKGTQTDPLLILGCDFITQGQDGQWDFINIGIHPFTKQDLLHFINIKVVK